MKLTIDLEQQDDAWELSVAELIRDEIERQTVKAIRDEVTKQLQAQHRQVTAAVVSRIRKLDWEAEAEAILATGELP